MNRDLRLERTDVSEFVWELSAASVRGKSHIESGLPNQDSLHVTTDASGQVVSAVVSDGAGTAKRSAEGATRCAKLIAQALCVAAARVQPPVVEADTLRSAIEAAIRTFRDGVEQDGGVLSDFHCTLVAWLFTPNASFVAQIGDSVALATRFAAAGPAWRRKIDFFPEGRYTFFEAERGEYSNETHFVTEPDWNRHLRIVEVEEEYDALVLMSDGAMDVAMLRGEVFRGFLSNLIAKLIETPSRDERNRIIRDWLDDPQTYRVTGDDKTAVVAIRAKRNLPDRIGEIVVDQRAPPTSVDRAKHSPATPPGYRAPRFHSSPASTSVEAGEDGAKLRAPSAGGTALLHQRSTSIFASIAAVVVFVAASFILYRVRASAGVSDASARGGRTFVDPRGGAPTARPLAAANRPSQALDPSTIFSEPRTVAEPAVAARTFTTTDVRYRGRTAIATVTLRTGAPATIARVTAESGLALEADDDACRPRLTMRAGSSCTVTARGMPGASNEERSVELAFESVDEAPVTYRVVFAAFGPNEASTRLRH